MKDSVIAILALGLAQPALAQEDKYDSEIVVGCHFSMGEFGNDAIHVCINANRAFRKKVEALGAEYDPYKPDCIRRRELGWEFVKQCIEENFDAAAALKQYPKERQALINDCEQLYRLRGPSRVKHCVDELAEKFATCPGEDAIAAYVKDFEAGRPSRGLGDDLSLDDARCARARLVRRLAQDLGPAIGYKAAFTNPALQQRFGVDSPEWGAMFGKMMLPSGARLPAQFGARPLVEADLAVVVKASGLADVNMPIEALPLLSEIVPFIELPDLMLEGVPTGPGLISTNVGFRGGVLGKGVPVEATPEFLEQLRAMTVVMTEDVSGKELGRAPGKAVMNNPINAALWIAKALRKEGIELKPGDILSLGGYVPPSPPQPGTSITVRYVGLPGDPSVTVHFE